MSTEKRPSRPSSALTLPRCTSALAQFPPVWHTLPLSHRTRPQHQRMQRQDVHALMRKVRIVLSPPNSAAVAA